MAREHFEQLHHAPDDLDRVLGFGADHGALGKYRVSQFYTTMRNARPERDLPS
jgi:hypothetical protein